MHPPCRNPPSASAIALVATRDDSALGIRAGDRVFVTPGGEPSLCLVRQGAANYGALAGLLADDGLTPASDVDRARALRAFPPARPVARSG